MDRHCQRAKLLLASTNSYSFTLRTTEIHSQNDKKWNGNYKPSRILLLFQLQILTMDEYTRKAELFSLSQTYYPLNIYFKIAQTIKQ